jgi:hypothetical protein
VRLGTRRRPSALDLLLAFAVAGALLTFWTVESTGSRGASPRAVESVAPSPRVVVPRRGANDFQAGASILVYGNDAAIAAKAGRVLDQLAADQVNSVSLVIPFTQSSLTASAIDESDALAPGDARIASIVREAHARGIAVMLQPVLDERQLRTELGEWRGSIKPADRAGWFASYGRLLQRYAHVASDEGIEVLDVGTELTSLEEDPHWADLVPAVREAYSGQVAYSLNWDSVRRPPSAVLRHVDLIGIDAYFPLDAPDDADTSALLTAWRAWVPTLEAFRAKAGGKPLVFTEVGIASQVGAFRRPWRWNHGTPVDLAAQERYYDASCRVARELKLRGLYWWSLPLDLPRDPQTDPTYAPLEKPAEAAIVRCFGTRGALGQ